MWKDGCGRMDVEGYRNFEGAVLHASEIASGVWIGKLERIQRRGTKFILGKWNLSYEERLKCLNLLSLEKRRYLFYVTFLYKALNGYLNVDGTGLDMLMTIL